MMIRARGPVWHRQHQQQGIIPAGLTGLDTEATWSYSKSDGWVYGHGTFCMVACTSRILGAFKWMRNSANEAKRMWLETGKLQGLITTVLMDSKADDKDLSPLLCFGAYQAHTHLAAAGCCLANKEAKRSSTLCPSWSRSCT